MQDASQAQVSRASFSRNRRSGVFVAYGSTATLEDVVIEYTTLQQCFPDGCPDGGGGNGITVVHDAAADVRRFRISRSALCGVQIAVRATLDLHDGEIAHNPIGANIQTEGFDSARLADGVRFVDNEADLDSSGLPLPDLASLE
jgi:hypothetical protein